jgi:pimeloyl-ACP methyl ester carboxylesterase
MRYLYLHGFASGPRSRKAQAFRRSFEQRGIELLVPELDEGDFAHLTITKQLNLLNKLIAGRPARLIGSSMGGYLAALYASVHPEIDRLVLLAPAFDFSSRWEVLTGPEKLADWRDTGWLGVFHYGEQTTRRVHFDLFEDASKHAPNPDFRQPARIFHGIHDEVVPTGLSRAFAASHPKAELTELDSDHELLNVLDEIVAAGVPFLIA